MGSAVKVALSRTAAKRAASVAQVRMRLFTVTALAEAAKKAVEAVLVGTWVRASLCGGQREERRQGACHESTVDASGALSHQCREVLQRFPLLDWSLALADTTSAAHSQSGGADTWRSVEKREEEGAVRDVPSDTEADRSAGTHAQETALAS